MNLKKTRKYCLFTFIMFFCVAVFSVHVASAQNFSGATFVREKGITSLQTLKHQNVVFQKTDFTCGAAALATILRYQYGLDINEQAIVATLINSGTPIEQIKEKGFSLLDLKLFAVALGFDARGFTEIDLDWLHERDMPIIVPVTYSGFDHFVVFRDIKEGRVFISDPALGNITMSKDEFKEHWPSEIAFIIVKPGEEKTANAFDAEAAEIRFVDPQQVARAATKRLMQPHPRTLSGSLMDIATR